MTTPQSILKRGGKQDDAPASADGEELHAGDTVTLVPSDEVATGDAVTATTPEDSPKEVNVELADETKDAVAEQSEAAGGAVEWLDSMAIEVGDLRLSAWDGLFALIAVISIFMLAWFASKFARNMLNRTDRLDASQRLLIEKILSITIWTLAILLGFDVLGIDLTALAVFSGAFGLAIGFGMQKTFGNFIAGVILLMDKSIKPGDIIAVADQAGNSTFGQIRKIGIRAVSITTRDQKEYLIPNENLMVNQVENWSYSSKHVRMQVEVGVSYNCDIHIAEKLMLEAANSCERVLESPQPSVWLNQYGESSVDFTIHCWISDPEGGVGNIRSEVLKKLWDLFQENDIEIPFPQRDLNLRESPQMEQLISAIAQRMDDRKK